jgi:tetratricopeptide (TPR) repeat protein
MDYTAVGDTTNLAARMENVAEPDTVLASVNTYRLVRDFFEFESLGKVEVKGKKEFQEAFKLIKPGEVKTRIGASVAKGLTRFVGRKNSMAVLMDAFDKVKSGSGQVVGVVGEAGVGKSRLLLEIKNTLPQGEYSYLEGRCLNFGGSMPYLPILDILRSYFEIKEGDQQFFIKKKIREKIFGLDEKLKGVIPPFQELLSLKTDDEDFIKLDPKEKRERTFEAIRDLMIRGSEDNPLVIAVEDVHWIDKTSEEFISYVIDWLANTRILLILLYRPEYTHQWGSKSYYRKIGLDQLGRQSSNELVKAILEEGAVAPELKELILNRAAGNPLFMEEFTHTLIENGSIERKDEKYVLSGKASDIQVPDTIQGIISARMDRLEDNLKQTMQVASVIGRDFAFRILQTITGMREELKSYLLNLQGLEFIYEKRLFPELEYIFKHALIQEVAYNSLLVKRRSEIHQSIGEAIESLYTDRLEEFYEMLAYHYSKSEDAPKACHYLKLSGEKAKGNFCTSESFSYYKKALNLLRHQPETTQNNRYRLNILKKMAHSIRLLVYPEGSIELIHEGARLAQDLKDEKALAWFQSYIGIYYMTFGRDPVKGKEYIERGLSEAELTKEVEIIVPATIDLIYSYILEGALTKVCQVAPRVIALIEKTHTQYELFGRNENLYSMLNGIYGVSIGAIGDFAKGERLLEKGLSLALDINNLYSIALIEYNHGTFYLFKGEFENAVKHYHSCIEVMEKADYHIFLGLSWAYLGLGYALWGQIDKALKCAEKGLKVHMELGIPFWLGSIHSALSEIHLGRGDLEKALTHARLAVDFSLRNNEKAYEAGARVTLGRIISVTDRTKFAEAEKSVRQGIEILGELQLRPHYAVGILHLGELYAGAQRKDEAIENIKKAEKMFEEMEMAYWPERAKELLAKP